MTWWKKQAEPQENQQTGSIRGRRLQRNLLAAGGSLAALAVIAASILWAISGQSIPAEGRVIPSSLSAFSSESRQDTSPQESVSSESNSRAAAVPLQNKLTQNRCLRPPEVQSRRAAPIPLSMKQSCRAVPHRVIPPIPVRNAATAIPTPIPRRSTTSENISAITVVHPTREILTIL